MIRMPPAVAEPGSAARSRVRFQELVPASPAPDANSADEPVKQGSSVDRQGFELQEDPSFWKDHSVQVVIRIRPLSSSEISLQGYNKCVRQDSCQTLTWTGQPESRFTFDIVADEHVSQEKLFKVAGVPMIENCVAGYNSCMFAYGQTGSGKTHTMLGDIESGTRRHSVNVGMTPRVFEYLFSRIQKEKDTRRDEKLRFTCRCSFLEIYNEQILDLLDPSSVNLQIREDAKKGVYVENLTEFEVSSARDVMQQLVQGAANRKVAATNMNRASSRSHSVFTCVIESKWESQGVVHHRFSRLNLVDLAGSERQKSSGAEGDRLKEATNINKSLSTLGLVIMNLVSISNKKSSLHVPYRDSKLTFLLQDSLGGNSKTIIIANISPSNCCALETLSTLKFAQRAKYIRNNAIINEDASGDVLAMRLQIQQLKKEVNRLRGLVNGGSDIQESDALNSNFPGSPAIFKWDGEQGSFSPLTYDKRLSQRKEYEAALVAAFRRDQEKEVALKALVAEKQALEQLAGQRTEEVQGLKMRLRFREEGIRRLEAVTSGKLASETHLLQEREELVKEIEILRNQVDRNPEITRFAMENLRLKEDLRRLQSFVEEGEREMMNEQITVLQDKLLEALDWKLMHENEKTRYVAQDLSLSWESSVNEENEFLRLQAIQNQREVDALRKNLNFCLEAKEKLERRVDELLFQIEEQKNFVDAQAEATHQLQISSPVASRTNVSSDDQIELKTMVDAIAAASQREAEAHETAIILAKENEELRAKLKVMIEDSNKLIELYEGAVAEGAKVASVPEIVNTGENCNASEDLTGEGHGYSSHDEYFKETKDVEDLERQLQEMHEENEKLLGLYENAMQERDEFKRRLSSNELKPPAKEEINSPEKLVEVYEERNCQNTKVVEEPEEYAKFVKISEQNLQVAETRLDTMQCKLITAGESVQFLGLLEMATIRADELSKEVEVVVCNVQSKQQQVTKLKYDLSRIHENKAIIDNKFVALKSAQKCFSSNDYWEGRLKRARARVDACRVPVEQRKEELGHLQIQKEEADAACMKSMQCETELRNNIDCLKSKFQDAETRRKESERILFSIENLNHMDAQGAMSFGKASELLKSEEERTELSAEMKQLQDKLATVQKEIANSKKVSKNMYAKIQTLEEEVKNGLISLEEAEVGLHKVAGENEMLKEMSEEGRRELDRITLDYQACIFESYLKEEEINMCEEELQEKRKNLEDLQNKRMVAAQRLSCLLEENRPKLLLSTSSGCAQFVSQKLEQELEDASRCVTEAKSLFIC